MKIFITGTAGQLGYDCVLEATHRGYTVIPSDVVIGPFSEWGTHGLAFHQLDITKAEEVQKTMEAYRPDAIIHCAAWTNVDGAEDPANRDKVFLINETGTKNIAEAAKAIDGKMIYISTDYVYDGAGTEPWNPACKDFAPLNVYGASKLAGEKAVTSLLKKFFIVRIAWVFGLNGKNFIKTMINVGKTHPEVRVVSDQIGTPTYTKDLARLLVDMVETDNYGFYHATNEGGYISWADLAEEAYRVAGMDVKVNRVSTAEYGASIAARPFNSRLDKSKLVEAGFKLLPDWKDAVKRYIEEAGLRNVQI